MNFLLSLLNAADRAAIAETNAKRLDRSLAFMLTPSQTAAGTPTAALGGPADGEHFQDELWVDAGYATWRCTAGGTPGTWLQIAPAVVAVAPENPPQGYLVEIAGTWKRQYWDGSAWVAA